MSRLIRFRESVRFSELAQIHRACSQNWTVSCNQISISINILLNTEYSCICCNHTVLVTVKWLTNALRNCSNESVRMNNSFANRTSVKHKGIGWTQPVLCCGCIKWGMDGQPRDPRYILMTFTEISTAVRSTNMWNIGYLNHSLSKFSSKTYNWLYSIQLLIQSINNNNKKSRLGCFTKKKKKKSCGTVPWYSYGIYYGTEM